MQAKHKITNLRERLLLYAITDRQWLGGETLLSQMEAAIKGGVSIMQLREKHMSDEEFLAEAREAVKLCRAYDVPLIINDRIDIALKSGADGVHIGQEDLAAYCAGTCNIRSIIGDDMILGISAHNVDQAALAEKLGADYLGCGAVFATDTKDDAGEMGLDMLREICSTVNIPVVAIGGISQEKIRLLKDTGIAGVAVISAIFAKPDKERAARDLSQELIQVITHQNQT